MSSSKPTASGSQVRSTKGGARASNRSKHRTGQRSESKPRVNVRREIFHVSFGIIWILLGLILTGIAIGAYIACNMVSDVLTGIEPYSAPRAQIELYEEFFDGLNKNAFKVTRDKPQIIGGDRQYFWQVKVLGTGEFRTFKWKELLAERTVAPLSNPALQLDLYLNAKLDAAKYHKNGDTQAGGFAFDPDDMVVQAIVHNDVSLLNLEQIAAEPEGLEGMEPVMAPRLSPQEAAEREHGAPEDEEDEVTDPGSGNNENESTEVDTGRGDSSSPKPPTGNDPDIVID